MVALPFYMVILVIFQRDKTIDRIRTDRVMSKRQEWMNIKNVCVCAEQQTKQKKDQNKTRMTTTQTEITNK